VRKTRKNNPTPPGKERSDEPASPIIGAGDQQAVSVKPAAKPLSKQQQLAALLVRDEGATLDHMIAVTGWLPHTTRAALTGLKKKGYALSSDKVGGVRTYRAVAPE
jgi:hypothetical protein